MMTATRVDTSNWQLVTDDNISTGSGQSGNEIMTNRPPSATESTYLRMPEQPDRVVYGTPPRKAVILSLSVTIAIVVCTVFATLYFSGHTGTNSELLKQANTDALTDIDHSVIIREIDADDEDAPMLADQPNSPAQAKRNKKRKSSRNRNQTTSGGPVYVHGHRQLPATAASEPPFSLLYHLRLVQGKDESFTEYHKCEEEDHHRKMFKGWKAIVTVNFKEVGFTPADNHTSVYIGYGSKRKTARQRAAQQALLSLYPGQLDYSDTNDLREIDSFCKEDPHTTIATTTTTNAPSAVSNSTSKPN